MSDLLRLAEVAVPPVTRKWADRYRVVWFKLRGNGFEPKQAARWIGEREGLSEGQTNRLYMSAKYWKEIG